MDGRRPGHQSRAGRRRRQDARQTGRASSELSCCMALFMCLTCILCTCLSTSNAFDFDLNSEPEGFRELWYGTGSSTDGATTTAQEAPQEPTSSPQLSNAAPSLGFLGQSDSKHANGHEPVLQANQHDDNKHDDDGEDDDADEAAGRVQRADTPLRTRAKQLWRKVHDMIPTYFDFNKFVTDHRKKYDKAEAYLRKTIFMRKVVDVFWARVDFRMGRIGYKQAVNKFSDKSREEFNLLFQSQPPPDLLLINNSHQHKKTGASSATDVHKYQKHLEARKKQLNKQAKQAFLLDIYTEFAIDADANPNESDKERALRKLDEMAESQRREFAKDPHGYYVRALMDSAIRDELNDMQFETMTQSTLNSFNQDAAELPWPGKLSSSSQEHDRADMIEQGAYKPPEFTNRQALDWSRHDCFFEVYNQGDSCGRCYVMAATALAEFYGCTERGEGQPIRRRKFSKDYVTDCAQKFSPNVMGCAGGSPYETLRFIATAGALNIRTWKSKRKRNIDSIRDELASGLAPNMLDVRCPLDADSTPYQEWGAIKVVMNPRPVHVNQWFEALQDGPLVASVQMPPVGVDSYAGGVHSGDGCESSGFWHAMLLVGYGISERGQPYWRFRNSFGPDWGDAGHFNLAMDIPGECFSGGVRVYREACTVCP